MSTDMLSAALAYARRGWPVFPCRQDKTPYVPGGVLAATTDPKQIEDWWRQWPGANIALNAGDAGFLVLDYDPGSDRDEVAAALGGAPPVTRLIASTPRGGTHEYYLLEPGDGPVASTVAPFARHVDVRSFHGYVLLPPSSTAAGSYGWVEEGKPASRSKALLAACRTAVEKDARRDEWLIEADLPENVDLAVKWLRDEARLAIEGRGGDNCTYAAAAMMKSYGLSQEGALETLWEHWNDRCSPPWEYDELAAKVGNAYEYNSSPPGNMTPGYHAARIAVEFAPRVEDTGGGGSQVTSGRFRIVDWQGMQSIPPPRWLVPDFLTEDGHALMIGARSSLKTFLALDAALTVATGGLPPWEEGEWEGVWEPANRPGPVLYVVGEGRAGFRQRVNAWAKLHWEGNPIPNFYLGDPVPRVLEGVDGLRAFVDAALKYSPDGYRLVVFDTVGRSMQGVNENAQEHASAFTALVEHVRRELGATVLGVHHTGHEHKERGRGSSVFEADADTIVVVDRPRADGRFTRLRMTKQKDAPEWDGLRWAEARTVQLAMGSESLVTVRASPPEVQREERQGKTSFDIIASYAMMVLRAHPGREITTNKFATMIASWRPEVTPEGDKGETVGVGDQAVRLTWLPRLRSEECEAREYYDVSKDRWIYRKGDDDE